MINSWSKQTNQVTRPAPRGNPARNAPRRLDHSVFCTFKMEEFLQTLLDWQAILPVDSVLVSAFAMSPFAWRMDAFFRQTKDNTQNLNIDCHLFSSLPSDEGVEEQERTDEGGCERDDELQP